jgi:hypothetical protein
MALHDTTMPKRSSDWFEKQVIGQLPATPRGAGVRARRFAGMTGV